jgi:hypothetical protein
MVNLLKSLILLFVIVGIMGCSKKDDPADCEPTLSTAVRCKTMLPECEGVQTGPSVRCLGKNVNGNRCGNNTTDICGFCHLHKEQ